MCCTKESSPSLGVMKTGTNVASIKIGDARFELLEKIDFGFVGVDSIEE